MWADGITELKHLLWYAVAIMSTNRAFPSFMKASCPIDYTHQCHTQVYTIFHMSGCIPHHSYKRGMHRARGGEGRRLTLIKDTDTLCKRCTQSSSLYSLTQTCKL